MNATLIEKAFEKGFRGTVKLWKLSEPVGYDYDFETGKHKKQTEYVVTSAVDGFFPLTGPETYIFPADQDGKVLDWGELEGSFQGDKDHERAIRGLCESYSAKAGKS